MSTEQPEPISPQELQVSLEQAVGKADVSIEEEGSVYLSYHNLGSGKGLSIEAREGVIEISFAAGYDILGAEVTSIREACEAAKAYKNSSYRW